MWQIATQHKQTIKTNVFSFIFLINSKLCFLFLQSILSTTASSSSVSITATRSCSSSSMSVFSRRWVSPRWIKVIWAGLLLHPGKPAISCHSYAKLAYSFMRQVEVVGMLSFSFVSFPVFSLLSSPQISPMQSLIRIVISQGTRQGVFLSCDLLTFFSSKVSN